MTIEERRKADERNGPFHRGKMAEKLGEFQFHFERASPHRPVWTLAGLSFVAAARVKRGNGGAIVMGGVARFHVGFFVFFFFFFYFL